MQQDTWNPRGYSVCATSALSLKRQNAIIEFAVSKYVVYPNQMPWGDKGYFI